MVSSLRIGEQILTADETHNSMLFSALVDCRRVELRRGTGRDEESGAGSRRIWLGIICWEATI